MKRFYSLSFALIIILLASCSKDDPKPDPLIGKWDMDYVKIEIKDNQGAADSLDGNYSPLQFTGAAARLILEFNADKTFVETAVFVDGSKSNTNGKWTKKESTLTLNYDDNQDDMVATISVSDSEELVFKVDQTLDLPDPNYPDDETKSVQVTASLTYNYSK